MNALEAGEARHSHQNGHNMISTAAMCICAKTAYWERMEQQVQIVILHSAEAVVIKRTVVTRKGDTKKLQY